MKEQDYIRLDQIVKVYPPNKIALNKVTLDIHKGEIHSIIGENGAGKSTLMKVLYGLEKANEGTIWLRGQKVDITTPQEAVRQGIGMVHQEFMLISQYTVLENIVLGNEPTRHGRLDLQACREKLNQILTEFKFDISLDEKIKNISIAAQQKVEIVKLLYRDVETLILDEPTAVLAPQEVDELFALLRKLRAQGKTIIFISHKLNEVLDISDRITVMRGGEYIWTKENKGLTKADLADAMVGRKVMLTVEKGPAKPGQVVLELAHLDMPSPGAAHKKHLDDVCLSIRGGEIVGIAGVEGNGQYELIQSVVGLMRPSGRISINGQDITDMSVKDRRRLIAYVPQDRKSNGSSQNDSLTTNSIMTHHYADKDFSTKFGILRRSRIHSLTQKIITDYQVSCQSAEMRIGELSGGNQQKVIVGREFELESSLLVVDQPVRGLDVGSIEYIHKRIVQKRDEGEAVLLVSADLDELFSLSDRIVVMYNGRAVFESEAAATSREQVGAYMLGAGGA